MSDDKYHPQSSLKKEYYTQQHTPPSRERRILSDGEVSTQYFDHGSRPVPVPRRVNSGQSPRAGSETLGTRTLTSTGQGPQGSSEIERLQYRVNELMSENKRLQDTIEMMKNREDDLVLKEQAIADRERDLIIKKSRMDSEYSDKEFELNQKRRDLQLLEDQLHMKNKDLQHREFDLQNADGPEDISSSKMADLADRMYELDKREEELKRKQEYFENWERKLRDDNDDYHRRMFELQQRETSLQEFINVPHNQVRPYAVPNPANQQFPHDQNYEDTQKYTEPQYNWDRTSHPVISSPGGQGSPKNWSSENKQRLTGIQQQQSVGSVFDRTMSEPFPDSPMPPPSPPQNEPIISAPGPGFVDDEDLARQLAEEEQKREQEHREKMRMLDQLLALQLQDEDLRGADYVTNVGQLSAGPDERTEDVIKRDLDSRLSEEQHRQRREREDFLYAQNLVDEANNSESNN